MSLESELSNDLPGESEMISWVAKAIRKTYAGLRTPDVPLGRFLLVGRNVTARKLAAGLARFLFGDHRRTLWLAMANYREKHEVGDLVGHGAGLFGECSFGDLAQPVRKQPEMVVVMEDIEKAHRDVRPLLIDAFAHGVLVDWAGCTIPLKNTIFVLTTKVGYWGAVPRTDLAVEPDGRSVSRQHSARVRAAVEREFPAEMLRGTFVDEILIELGTECDSPPETASVEG